MDKKPEMSDAESETTLTTTDLETSEGKVILSNKINKEIDKIFGPAIQRNRSSSDIEIIGPFKRRHYWSQERLFADKTLQQNQGDELNRGLNSFQIDELKSLDEAKSSQIPVLHENQRAEIVASVTERLYSKLKRNEKVIPKIESVLDRKSIQPLSELKICSNARQRLMELSQKALRNKRRIGIPAYTQTRGQVTRVKNQGIEIQSDLQSFIDLSPHNSYSLRKDASIQSELMTPRFKDKAVGSDYDTVNCKNKDTATQTNIASFKDDTTMTHVLNKGNHSTQTMSFHQIKRNKNSMLSKKCANEIDSSKIAHKDNNNLSPFININISPIYCHESEDSSDSEDFTDDDSESLEENISIFDNNTKEILTKPTQYEDSSTHEQEVENEFSDEESAALPRVVMDPIRNIDIEDYEELILGLNENTYPYNIKLSPCKSIDESKRIIKFEDNDFAKDSAEEDSGTNFASGSLCTESPIKLPEPEYSNEQFTTDIEESIQQSTVFPLPSNLEKDNETGNGCNYNEVLKRNTTQHFSPVRLQNECDTDDTELATSLYYSLNSFFKTRPKKLTPTEYLHYLIQKRREAISIDSSRFYQRNISF